MAAAEAELKLGYWDIRGLAQPIKMALALGEVKYEYTTYAVNENGKDDNGNTKWDASEWHGDGGAKKKLAETVDFINLPYMVHGDVSFAESIACLTYAAELAGHHRNFTDAQKAKALAFAIQIQNIRNKAVGFFYGFGGAAAYDGDDGAITKQYVKDIRAMFKPFNKILDGKSYLLGKGICSADFHLAEMIYQHYLLEKTIFDDYPETEDEEGMPNNLKSYAKEFFALEPIKAMEEDCKKNNLAINNKMAKWGQKFLDADLNFGME